MPKLGLHVLRRHRVPRFALVGIANAAVSFGLLNLCFYAFGLDKIAASIVATTCAVAFSFMLNRNFVFADKTRRVHRQLAPFVAVTVSGSLGVLNLVYAICVTILSHHDLWLVQLIHSATDLRLAHSFVDINLSTAIGAVVAMAWNYNGYRLFVFKGVARAPLTSNDEIEAA
jgi:putative flippase GtrA